MLLSFGVAAGLALGFHAQLVAPLPRVPLPRPAAGAVRAAINDNRVPAGVRAGGVLTLAIDVIESAWRPEGGTDPEVRRARVVHTAAGYRGRAATLGRS